MKLINVICTCGRWFERQDTYDAHLPACAAQEEWWPDGTEEDVRRELARALGLPEITKLEFRRGTYASSYHHAGRKE